MPDDPASRALAGIRVLDLSQFEAGPSCTELLAWLGADVVKVEPPGRGEQGRHLGSDPHGPDSYYFILLNLNKRSITLNLKEPEGQRLLRQMVPRFDVLIENYTLGTLEGWGLGWDVLSAEHPGLVYASIRGFGNSGPYSSYKSFDMVGQAAGGAMSMNGERDGPPLKLGVTLGDTGTGVHCAVGILAALLQRERTGRGQRVEVSMQEAVANYSRVAINSRYVTGRFAKRNGNRVGAVAPGDLYACAGDGPNDYAYVFALAPAMWEGVLKTIGRADLLGDPEWSNPAWRAKHVDELRNVIEEWTRQRDKFEVMEAMEANGVPCSAVFDSEDLLGNPHLRERGMVTSIDHPERGAMDVLGNPIRLDQSPTTVSRSPLLGEHNDDLYGELLGMSSDDLDRLRAAGIV